MRFEGRVIFPDDDPAELDSQAVESPAANSAKSAGEAAPATDRATVPFDDLSAEFASLAAGLSDSASRLASLYPPGCSSDLPIARPKPRGGWWRLGSAAAAILLVAGAAWTIASQTNTQQDVPSRPADLAAARLKSTPVAAAAAPQIALAPKIAIAPVVAHQVESAAAVASDNEGSALLDSYLEVDGSAREAIVDLELDGKLERVSFAL